ncbi:MAG TPA: SpoIID/LytB domain-containing protein [Thermoanaerobaculia bacterium]|nr:SpoIID/LytB domain-containing protein [Thermoanaerobaculia bacterium]
MKSKLLPVLALLVLTAGCTPKTPPRVVSKSPPPKTRPAPAPVQPAPAKPKPKPAPREPVVPQETPAEAPYDEKEPLLVKVGLASDLEGVTFPCCEEPLQVAVETQEVAAVSSLRVEPAAASAQKGFYRLQVAALRDERQAQDLAKRLERDSGQPGDAYFDAGIDLYRIRVGHYPTREAAEADLKHLTTMGVTGGFVVNEGGSVTQPALRLTQGQSSQVYPGRWLSVAPLSGPSVRVQGKRYRGRMLVYLNDRGALNLINELPVEDYLRGVVPSEMGPELYRQLEALKAQAVAARTYTLRNMGEFSREGYDICATPRCQVYGGMQVEHPLSDRAVSETAGQVLLYKGELVDALYSSTCGGHTEDVHVIFPLKNDPYLKGVPCMESGMARLDGDLGPGVMFPAGLTRRLLPPAAGSSAPAAALGARMEHLALLAGLAAPKEPLTSLDRREVQRYVSAAFDLALDARLFLAPEDVAYLLTDPPADWSEEDRRRAAYLLRSGLLGGPLDQPLSAEQTEKMLLALAELLHVVRREEVSFFSVADGKLTVRSGKDDKVYDLPTAVATFRRQGSELYSAGLNLVPGDLLTLFWQGDRLIALTQELDLDGVAFDRSSPYSSWSRYRTDSQLAAQVNTRFPGFAFQSFEVLERGESGRVGKIRIYDDQGKTQEVDGLAVRWTLDVPDTLFTAKRLAPKNQEPGWLFTGKGFGHGVGMCQVGAYGMAQRGHTYREILTHYYTGVELGKVRIRNRGGATR